MTKKHYEAIAAIIKARYFGDKNDDGDNAVRSIALAIADYLARDNPKFTRTRFLQACGIEQ